MLQNIILNQKAELERRISENYTPREIQLKGSDTALVNVVIGPRRAGKSFFLMHTLSNTNDTGYVNFDEERLLKVENFDEIKATELCCYRQNGKKKFI